MAVRQAIKSAFSQVSWKHPAVRAGLPFIDAADWLARAPSRDLRQLPPYSARIRSRGVHAQFGGRSTARSSEQFLHFMQSRAGLRPDSRVLDIGSGCGLTALAFAKFLEHGAYTGVDIDLPSVRACKRSRRLTECGFTFVHARVQGDVYGDDDGVPAAEYRFPLPSDSFSHVMMTSVVTHLMPAEVENYLRETSRLLRGGGRVVFSTFLLDYGTGCGVYTFPYDHGDYHVQQETLPRKGVAYRFDYLSRVLQESGLVLEGDPIIGSWRDDPDAPVADPVVSVQDLLIAARP